MSGFVARKGPNRGVDVAAIRERMSEQLVQYPAIASKHGWQCSVLHLKRTDGLRFVVRLY